MPTPEKGEQWGILGGTFDPVHRGHLTLARDILRQKPLDGVLLIPAYKHPFKTELAAATYEERLAMLRLVVPREDRIVIDEIEKERQLPGFTLDTVRAVKHRYPEVSFYFLIGADNIAQIASWHKPAEIFDEVGIIAGTRPTFAPDEGAGPYASRVEYIQTTPVDISSTRIRELIGKGAPRTELIKWLDPRVYDYILTRGLYR